MTGAEMRTTFVLIRRYQDGDSGALNILIERYYRRVLRIVRIRASPELLAGVEPEDLVQETFLTALPHFRQFEMRHESALIQWLAVYAESLIRNAARKESTRARRHAQQAAGTEVIHFEPLDPQSSPSDRLQRREEEELVDRCVAALSPDRRHVILLRDYQDAPWELIAEELDRSVPACQMLHRRARNDLGEALARLGLSDGGQPATPTPAR